MKKVSVFITAILLSFFLFAFTANESTTAPSGAKYVGAKKCGMCHKSKTGNQYKIWKNSKHAKAYETLLTDKANKIAAKRGLGKAAEAKECLSCHVTGHNDATAVFDKHFKVKSGVQCETCHGAGSKYKSMKTMKNREKAISKGLVFYKNDAAIEAQCKTCHNEKSPNYKNFNFKKMWAKIAHPIPKK